MIGSNIYSNGQGWETFLSARHLSPARARALSLPLRRSVVENDHHESQTVGLT